MYSIMDRFVIPSFVVTKLPQNTTLVQYVVQYCHIVLYTQLRTTPYKAYNKGPGDPLALTRPFNFFLNYKIKTLTKKGSQQS